MIARVRGASPARLARIAALTIGMKKHNDLPEPVPVVTTKLRPAAALTIASRWWRRSFKVGSSPTLGSRK
jgi:hypothetical protein